MEGSDVSVKGLLGGSWVVISGVISPLIWVITIVTLLLSPLTTTHEPPSILRSLHWILYWGLGVSESEEP